ncbi:MAG: aminopeptidase P family N-terminal domain-containing protein [Lachnospiraceae bacterium]|jgi:Xaa-Pro aminopeptidase|nr:aminopeptidase P family N-terminal domain-containing protein [Lachnospiraceae bacterium]
MDDRANLTKARLAALRVLMKEAGMDAYIIPTADFHQSEYVGDYFKCRAFVSGFTGSAGNLVVTMDESGLWTDSRYFIQAEKELAGSEVALRRTGEPDTPTIEAYLAGKLSSGAMAAESSAAGVSHIPEGEKPARIDTTPEPSMAKDMASEETIAKAPAPSCATVGFDGRVVSAHFGRQLREKLSKLGIRIDNSRDLVGEIWPDRPALPCGPVKALHLGITGCSAQEKLSRVRAKMKDVGATVHLITALDDIMWLLNIRGGDVAYNPVALCYMLLTHERATLFIQEGAVGLPAGPCADGVAGTRANVDSCSKADAAAGAGKDVTDRAGGHIAGGPITGSPISGTLAYLRGIGVDTAPYDGIYAAVGALRGESVLLERAAVSDRLHCLIDGSCHIVDTMNPTTRMKAVKNPTEVRCLKEAHVRDGVALTRFLRWIKEHVGKEPMTELSVSAKLESLRREQAGFFMPSFPTISAYGANAAMAHYSPGPGQNADIGPMGFYLVDSGGQYEETGVTIDAPAAGTTDVTRTVTVGEISDVMRTHFTLVAIGMLRLANARFPMGVSGFTVDYAARDAMWQMGLDYGHGTGHGVGYLLNVHERPQSFRCTSLTEHAFFQPILPGMVTSDEPGLYVEGSHGIRLENLLLCVEREKTPFGQFLGFEYLTFAPLDLDALDLSLMDARDIRYLNAYHKQVYDTLSPRMDAEEREWLAHATRAV